MHRYANVEKRRGRGIREMQIRWRFRCKPKRMGKKKRNEIGVKGKKKKIWTRWWEKTRRTMRRVDKTEVCPGVLLISRSHEGVIFKITTTHGAWQVDFECGASKHAYVIVIQQLRTLFFLFRVFRVIAKWDYFTFSRMKKRGMKAPFFVHFDHRTTQYRNITLILRISFSSYFKRQTTP